MTTTNTDTCICGTDTDQGPCHAAHWDTPTGWTLVVWSCSPECESRIEALRVRGRLTIKMVEAAR